MPELSRAAPRRSPGPSGWTWRTWVTGVTRVWRRILSRIAESNQISKYGWDMVPVGHWLIFCISHWGCQTSEVAMKLIDIQWRLLKVSLQECQNPLNLCIPGIRRGWGLLLLFPWIELSIAELIHKTGWVEQDMGLGEEQWRISWHNVLFDDTSWGWFLIRCQRVTFFPSSFSFCPSYPSFSSLSCLRYSSHRNINLNAHAQSSKGMLQQHR